MRTQAGWLVCMAAAVVSMAAAGCGSNSDPVSGPQYTYPDVVSYCAARAKAECNAMVLDGCQSAESSCLTTRQGLACQAVPPGATYRPAQADACIAAVTAAYSDNKLTEADLAAIDSACAKLFGGSGGEGSACAGNSDCDLDAGLECVKPTGADAGTCQKPQTMDPGDPCSAANAVCKDGYFCTSSTPKSCAKKLPSGEACNDVLPCDDTLRCVPSGTGTDGTCQPKLAVQSSCHCPLDPNNPPNELPWCESTDCADGLCSQIVGQLKCASALQFYPNEPICLDYR